MARNSLALRVRRTVLDFSNGEPIAGLFGVLLERQPDPCDACHSCYDFRDATLEGGNSNAHDALGAGYASDIPCIASGGKVTSSKTTRFRFASHAFSSNAIPEADFIVCNRVIRDRSGKVTPMSRKSIALVLFSYFLAALAFGTLEHWLASLPQWNLGTSQLSTVGEAVKQWGEKTFATTRAEDESFTGQASRVGGAAIGLFAMSGLLPLIGWAFVRFRAQNAFLPVLAWGLLGLAIGGLSIVGQQSGRAQGRDDFLQGIKQSCGKRNNEPNRPVGVTDQQIDDYCECIAESITNQVVTEEIKFIAQTGKLADSLKEKTVQSYAKCGRSFPAFGKPAGRLSRAEQIQLGSANLDLPVPSGLCALSEERHKEQLAFARQVNPAQKLLLLMVPCDRLALYEPNSSAPASTSLLFDTAEWATVLDSERAPLKASGSTISLIKSGMQEALQALNAARASGQRYPPTGPELRNVTIVDERRDRIFSTSINRFQRPFDRGPVDRYGAAGFVVVAPYVFNFKIFSYMKNENDLLAIAERIVDAASAK